MGHIPEADPMCFDWYGFDANYSSTDRYRQFGLLGQPMIANATGAEPRLTPVYILHRTGRRPQFRKEVYSIAVVDGTGFEVRPDTTPSHIDATYAAAARDLANSRRRT